MKKRVVQYDPEDEDDVVLSPELERLAAAGRAILEDPGYADLPDDGWEDSLPLLDEDDEGVTAIFAITRTGRGVAMLSEQELTAK